MTMMQSFLLPPNGEYTPEEMERRRALAQALLAQSQGTEPIGSPWQGAAKLASALMGGLAMRKANGMEAASRKAGDNLFSQALGAMTPGPAPANDAIMGGGGTDALVGALGNDKMKKKPLSITDYAGKGAVDFQANGIRNMPIQKPLEAGINEAVMAVYGPGYKAQVYSGGQPRKGTSNRRTGSTRHDEGFAADLYVVGPDGKRVRGEALAKLGQYWLAKKMGGVGMEMRDGGIHMDLHTDRAPTWNYAQQGGSYSPEQAKLVQAGLQGQMPQLLAMAAPNTAKAALAPLGAGAPAAAAPAAPMGTLAARPPVPQQAPQVMPAAGPAPAAMPQPTARPMSAYDRMIQTALAKGSLQEPRPGQNMAPQAAIPPQAPMAAPPQPQPAPAPGMAPQTANSGQGGAMPSAARILAFMQNPDFSKMRPEQQRIVLDLYRQAAEAERPPDPMKQLQQQKLQLEIDKMRQPDGGTPTEYGTTPQWYKFKDQEGNEKHGWGVIGKDGTFKPMSPPEKDAEWWTPGDKAEDQAEGKLKGDSDRFIVKEYVEKIRPALTAARESLASVVQARTMLENGIQTGAGAEIFQGIRNWGLTLGLNIDESVLANTQAYQNFIGNIVIPKMQQLGGNDSNEEMRKMYALSGGDITQSHEALRLTLAYTEKLLKKRIADYQPYEDQAQKYLQIPDVPIDAGGDVETPAKAPADMSDEELLRQLEGN